MKKWILASLAFCLFCGLAQAQSGLPAVDKSPLDVSYYPAGYPAMKMQGKTTDPPVARIIYSRPKKEGRSVFGGLVPYGKVWRLGANEATEIEFYKPVTIGGKKIAAGRYTLYALVNEKTWTFILNKDLDTWGAFKYDESKDIVRTEVPTEANADTLESLAMAFVKSDNNFNLVVGWENTKAILPISL